MYIAYKISISGELIKNSSNISFLSKETSV